MAQVKLLKIAADGVPLEFDSTNDDITLKSFTTASGASLGATGLAMNNLAISGILSASFQDPTTGFINQTAGNLIVDNIMAKEHNNVMTTAGGVIFPLVTDTAAQVDAFKIPNIAGAPTATPSTSSVAGYMVFDSTNKNLYVWDGAAWDNYNTVGSAQYLDDSYTTSATVAARDVLYISGAGTVAPADCTTATKAQAIGLAVGAAASAASVACRRLGRMTGFTGLTAGSRYFLSSTGGAVTATIPSTSGHTVVQIGYALSTTEIEIQIQQMGRRA